MHRRWGTIFVFRCGLDRAFLFLGRIKCDCWLFRILVISPVLLVLYPRIVCVVFVVIVAVNIVVIVIVK